MDKWLQKLGFDHSFYEGSIADIPLSKLARVSSEHQGGYCIEAHDGSHVAAVTGKLMHAATERADYPAVGDWILLKESTADSKVIEQVLPRKTTLYKRYVGKRGSQLVAANVDVALIVSAVGRDYNLNRIERYVVLAGAGNIRPVIVLNKVDMLEDEEVAATIEELRLRFDTVDIMATSIYQEARLNSLMAYVAPGTTYCFLGSSGVGKSSLINRLLEKEQVFTREIGSKSQRGRHATTSRQMYFMDGGGILIDNPGSREVGITGGGEGISRAYTSVDEVGEGCRFKDCTHTVEPGCAVIEALADGSMDRAQYDNYLRLRKEAEFCGLSAYEKRQRDRSFGKYVKNAKKDIRELEDPEL